jgi:hypothetical protein
MQRCDHAEGYPGGLIKPMSSSAGAYSLALLIYTKKVSEDKPDASNVLA